MNNVGWVELPKMPDAFPLGTDSVLLADFVQLHGNKRICDLGAGAGTVSLLMAMRHESSLFHGIELQPASVLAAQAAIVQNKLEGRVTVTEGDIRTIHEFLPSGVFDCVVSNPPYFPAGSGAVSDNPVRRLARSEEACPPDALCKAAAYLLKYGGCFCLVHRPERLSVIMSLMTAYKLEPKRLRFVKQCAASAPTLFLLEAKRGGKPGLLIQPDLLLKDDDGSYSPEYKRIYHLGGTEP